MQRPPRLGLLRVRSKIIVPYLLTALLLTLAMVFVAVRLTAGALQERIDNRLIEAGQSTSDALVAVEEQHLAQLRAMVFTQGVTDAIAAGNREQLTTLLQPHWVNANLSLLIAFDQRGQQLIGWQRGSQTSSASLPEATAFSDLPSWWIVQQIRAGRSDAFGDKFSALAANYLLTAAPVRQDNKVVGGIIVGIPLQRLVEQLQARSWASVTTFYNAAGEPIISTQQQTSNGGIPSIPDAALDQLRNGQNAATPLHIQSIVELNEREYQFAFSPLQVRRATDGYFSVGFSRQFIIDAWGDARIPVVILSVLMLMAMVGIGLVIARHITRPLHDLVAVADAVANGHLDRRAAIASRDELGVVAHSFNHMTERLVHLYETSRTLSAQSQIGSILAETEAALHALVPHATMLVMLADRDGYRWYTSEQIEGWARTLDRQPVEQPEAWLAQAEAGAPFGMLALDPALCRQLHVPEHFAEGCLAPLQVQGRTIGLLVLLHEKSGLITPATQEPLVAVASMTATALHNTRLYLAVQQEGQQRRVILESIADGVVVCDASGTIVLMNDAAEALLEIDDWPQRTYNFNDLPLTPIDDHHHLLSTQGESYARYEMHGRILGTSRAPLASAEHGLSGAVIVLHNISDEVALDRAKTELIGMISHELRTPLTGIQGSVDLLAKGIGGQLSPLQLELAEAARRQSRAMSALIDKAVLVANIETGALTPHFQQADVADLVETVVARFEPRTSSSEVHIDLPVDLPPVLVDPQMVAAALHEIVDNALKYGDGAPVEISARTSEYGIDLFVRDAGPGIAPEVLPHLFRRLSRNADSSNTRLRGLGLGLVIARGLIERQNGTIYVQSEPGQGSLFTVSVPGVRDAQRSAA